MSLGNNIKKLRKHNNLTQTQLADTIGVKAITIRKYESDDREPNIETLKKIAEALNVPVAYLLDSQCSLTYKLINTIAKSCLNNSKNNNLDFFQELYNLIGIDHKKIAEIIDDPLAELPLPIRIKLLTYLSELDHSAFLEFCEINKSCTYPKEIKEKIEEILFSKLSEVETNSFLIFKKYLLTTFGDDVKDLKEDDLKDLQTEVDKFLEFALFKLQKITYGEETEDEDN